MITPGQKYAVRVLFGIPWIVFAIQHYMYADFVSTLVAPFMPWRLFWAYFTGTAMLAAGVSFIIGRQVQLAAFLLGCLMILYLLTVHPLLLSNEPGVGMHWTRFMQDISIMAAAFALAGSDWRQGTRGTDGSWERARAEATARNWGPGAANLPWWRALLARRNAPAIIRYVYALPFIVLGAQHFTHNAFVTAKVPDWAPFSTFWDYVIGLGLIAAVYALLFTSRIRRTASTLGTTLIVLALLRHVPLLIINPRNPGEWTNSFLDLALAAGAFFIAETADQRRPADHRHAAGISVRQPV